MFPPPGFSLLSPSPLYRLLSASRVVATFRVGRAFVHVRSDVPRHRRERSTAGLIHSGVFSGWR